ncbi:uncharacterized protein LOC121383623 [Gigantopelta aegis]|uniref:uncharacterized protein LOC121383623 n=1 Tax=Gigantopelta aegis TaxID=1735272 RepID=UPI001B888E92|nr:uncharacterized protein LOC121383623 [Gigantopelta aegis]
MAGKQTFGDLKYLFIRGLINYEKWQRSRHYLKSAAEWTSRAIVSLELTLHHIKTVHQAMRLEGIGRGLGDKLKDIISKQQYSEAAPHGSQYITSAAAILVTLLKLTHGRSLGSSDTAWIPEDILKYESQQRCEEKFLKNTNSGFCCAWWWIEILINRQFIKRRLVKKVPVYELLPLGRNIAVRLLE